MACCLTPTVLIWHGGINGLHMESLKKETRKHLCDLGERFCHILEYFYLFLFQFLKDGLSTLHVPYAYGFAIILLTVLVKAATFPLSKKQVESAMAMRSLQPQIKAIQERYAGDQERLQLETARLYKLAGINPLAGIVIRD
ncbi:putative membrane insertase YidC/ALB3/OXA1/COX18 [Helianthus debilis subsp. tardiflorus]